MPPWIPPLLFVFVVNLGRDTLVLSPSGASGALMNGSLCTLPGIAHPPKPEPISKPFVDGIESMACASLASNFSKEGSPSPGGTERKTQVMVPPMLSFESRNFVMRASMRAEVAGSGHRVGANESTFSRVISSSNRRDSGFVDGCGYMFVGGKRHSEPTEDVNATISMP
jgi:hypothetical protein